MRKPSERAGLLLPQSKIAHRMEVAIPLVSQSNLASLGAITLLFIGIAGCGDKRGVIQTERTDSAGVEIILSTGEDHILDWSFERLFALGGAEAGPESFYRVVPGLVDADAHGNLYVLNSPAAEVAVFDSAGGFVRSMGSRGAGPSEIQQPSTMSVSAAGVVAIFDFGKATLVRYTLDSGSLPPVGFRHFPTPTRQRHFAISTAVTFVVTMDFSSPGHGPTHVLRRFTATDTTTLTAVSFPSSEMAMYPRCGGGLNLPPIFAAELVWDAQEDLAAVNKTPDYVIDVFERGVLVRSVRRRLKTPVATPALAAAELGEGFRINFGQGPCLIPAHEMVEKRGFAAQLPLIVQVAVAPDGEIWVLRRDAADLDKRLVDVFGSDGAYLGTLTDADLYPVAFLGTSRLATVETDSLDVDRLVVYNVGR